MENQFYDNDFERWLQDQTRMHRLYPSDAIWKGIYKQLHGHRTWPGLNFFAIVTVAALTILTVLADRPSLDQADKKITPEKQDVAFTSIADHLDPAKATQRTFELIQRRREQSNDDVADVTQVNDPIATVSADNSLTSNLDRTVHISSKPQLNSIASLTTINNAKVEELIATIEPKEQPVNETPSTEELKVEEKKDAVVVTEVKEEPKLNGVDKYLEEQADEIIRLNKKPASREPRWGIQFYITPSASFRELTNKKNISTDNNSTVAPVAPNVAGTDVNEVVKHRPGMGTEFGVAVTYNLTDRLKMKAGGQLNIRQYNIEAYRGASEQAAIALVRGNHVDTFSTYAIYRSKEGYTPTILTNKYYQISMPVGVEFALLKNRKVSLGVGTTLQPTYTITPDASYFITTDYNSYADGTQFLRRWNLNSSFEAILTYKVGTVQWRLSPQVRYQLLSTYVTPYPIREHLIDYGIKIGFAKSL